MVQASEVGAATGGREEGAPAGWGTWWGGRGGGFPRTDHRQKCRSQGPAQRKPLRFQNLVFAPSRVVLLLPLPSSVPLSAAHLSLLGSQGLPRALPLAQVGQWH